MPDQENHEEAQPPVANESPQRSRGHWVNPLEFFISCLGYAVGLGNVWRFPLLCFKHGGGSFLIPYFLMLFGAGLPMFFLEVSLGQYSGVGPIKTFERLSPVFKGLGHALVCVGLLLAFFYNVVVSWAIFYFATSVTSYPLAWATCDHSYNTENCFSRYLDVECNENSTEAAIYFNNSCVSASATCLSYGLAMKENSNPPMCLNGSQTVPPGNLLGATSTSVQEFWDRHVLGGTDDYNWYNFGTPRIQPLGALFVAWLTIAIGLLKGVKTLGKVSYVTSIFPYVLLTIIGIRGFTLPGAIDGIIMFLTPKWSTLLTFELWVDAATQIIFSLGPACGCVITLSSYNMIQRNCHRDAIFIAILNSATSILSGFVIFSILGFMAHDKNVPVEEVVKGGPGLAFIAYPEVMTRIGGFSNFFSALFFLMLFTLALGSIFAAFETVISAVCDQFPRLRESKPQLVMSLSAVTFLLGLTFTCPAGIHMFNVFNASAPSWNLLFFALLEVIIVGWCYGADRLMDNISTEMGIQMSRFTKLYWIICWKFVTPLVLTVLLLMALANFGHVRSDDGTVYPLGVQIMGYLITGSTIIWLPIFAFIEIRKRSKDPNFEARSLIEPTPEWGRQIETVHIFVPLDPL